MEREENLTREPDTDEESEEEEDEDEPEEKEEDETEYDELKAHLKTMTEDERIKYRNFETLRNTANGFRPDYKMEKIYKAIKELTKEEMEEDNMIDPYDYWSPRTRAQYERDMEEMAREAEEEQNENDSVLEEMRWVAREHSD